MSDGVDTSNSEEAEPSADDTPLSDATQESGETDSDSVEQAEEPSAGEDGEQSVDGDTTDDAAAEDGEQVPDVGAESAEKPSATPPPPEGYTSWDEVAREAHEARRLRTQWEQALPLLTQALQGQQKPAAPEPPAKRPVWDPPHADDPEVQRALNVLRADPEAFKKLPDHTRVKAQQAESYRQSRWNEYFDNPERLVEEIIFPKLDTTKYASKVEELEKRLARYEEEDLRRRGREELQKHASVIKTAQDQQELLKLVTENQMALPAAVELIALRRKAAEFEAQRSKLDEKAKSQAALSQRTRAAQGTKRGQRPGKPSAELLGTTDLRAIHAKLKALGRLEE
jgi:hypothetical protein